MSEDAVPQSEETPVSDTKSAEKSASSPPDRIFLVSYPKIVFLYPSAVFALIAGTYMAIAGHQEPPRADTYVVSLVFLLLLAVNLVVLSFDFPRTTSLTIFFFFASVSIGLWFLFSTKPDLLPFVGEMLAKIKPLANAQFYFLFAGLLGIIYLGVMITVRFDYWEVRPNELLHHHGMWSNLERFSAPNMRIDKEINDVFEYLLLRAGRLIVHPSSERKAIVLENVFFINRKEKEITRMLGALQVQLRKES